MARACDSAKARQCQKGARAMMSSKWPRSVVFHYIQVVVSISWEAIAVCNGGPMLQSVLRSVVPRIPRDGAGIVEISGEVWHW